MNAVLNYLSISVREASLSGFLRFGKGVQAAGGHSDAEKRRKKKKKKLLISKCSFSKYWDTQIFVAAYALGTSKFGETLIQHKWQFCSIGGICYCVFWLDDILGEHT